MTSIQADALADIPPESGDEESATGDRSFGSKVISGYAEPSLRGLGAFFGMSLDIMVGLFRPPFIWTEYVIQCWFIVRVSLVAALLLTLPWALFFGFLFNILLSEVGASDLAGWGAAAFGVDQLAPIVATVVVAGAGATAMAADLGARTIREELDALRVMGIDPIRRLAVPRVAAMGTVAVLLGAWVTALSLLAAYVMAVYHNNVSPGPFVESMTTITHVADVVMCYVKCLLFGVFAGLIACYKGMTVDKGAAAVGQAVAETVVFSFLVLYSANMFVTAVFIKFLV